MTDDANDKQSDKKGKEIRIKVDRNLCIGASTCVAIAETVFQLDDEGKAYVVDPDSVDADTVRLAAESCPTKAISLFDNDDNQTYP
jgi:ferredoxin